MTSKYQKLPAKEEGISYIKTKRLIFLNRTIPCFLSENKVIKSLWMDIIPADTSDFADLAKMHNSFMKSNLLDRFWIVMNALNDEMGEYDFLICVGGFVACVIATVIWK